MEEDESMKWCNEALKKISQYMQAKAFQEKAMLEMENNAASLIKQQEPQNILRHG